MAADLAVFGLVRVEHVESHDFGVGVAEHLAGSRVRQRYPAGGIHDHDAVRGLFDQGPEVTLAVGQRDEDRVQVEKTRRHGLVRLVRQDAAQARPGGGVRPAASRRLE